MYILFEHATGYALFKVNQFEEIASNLPQLQDNLADYTKFITIVKFVAFAPFKSATNALDNINSISEGILHEDLYLFLDTNLPKLTKSGVTKNVDLGVFDAKLATSIAENGSLGANCVVSGPVPDLMRGIRQHFTKIIKVISDVQESKAQLGLAHSYSRAKVKFNVNRVDNMIIQSIAILDQLDKDINKFAMRLREWYSYHYPELYKLVPDNILYAKVVNIIKNRKELASDVEEKLEELLSDSSITQAIIKSTKSSMGMDISPLDLNMICKFSNRVIGLGDFKQTLVVYLQSKMNSVAPNLAELLGESVGARLISHAGSLSNLAKCPASTIQILGAEKALFRALKTRGNTPKYGLLFHSTFIGRAGPKDKGRISRYLANKCAIASRIDCFSDIAVPVYGKFLKAQVENRLKFLAGDEEPLKNDEVMIEAKAKADEYLANRAAEIEKVKKKKKKRQADQTEEGLGATEGNTKKKTKTAIKSEGALEDEVLAEVMEEEGKDIETQEKLAKKKRKKLVQEVKVEEEVPAETEVKRKKKNKNKFKAGE